MQTLNQDIKDRTFKPVYLLFGEEAFLKKSYKSRLREALTDGDTMNYNYFEGKGMNVNEIIGLADTMHFFAEKRLVLLEDSGFFKGGAGADELTEYMGGIPESTCLVFVESEVDKRSRLYKAVKKYGYAAELSHQEPAQLARWAAGILSKNGRKITGRTMEFFLSKAGDDMDLYEDLLTLKEPPMRILFLIARQFNQILQVKDLMGKGMDKSTIASRLKLQPFVVGKIMLQAKTFTREQILSYVNLCVDAEEGVKTGKLQDRLAVELLIANKYE